MVFLWFVYSDLCRVLFLMSVDYDFVMAFHDYRRDFPMIIKIIGKSQKIWKQ
jgi:hypothetical protein